LKNTNKDTTREIRYLLESVIPYADLEWLGTWDTPARRHAEGMIKHLYAYGDVPDEAIDRQAAKDLTNRVAELIYAVMGKVHQEELAGRYTPATMYDLLAAALANHKFRRHLADMTGWLPAASEPTDTEDL